MNRESQGVPTQQATPLSAVHKFSKWIFSYEGRLGYSLVECGVCDVLFGNSGGLM